MKIKTALISFVVSATLIAGAGYGAYFVMQNQKIPVDVMPVEYANRNYGFFEEDLSTIYGSITSQVSQTVFRTGEYPIEQIYVSEGTEVKVGDPLFSYDMTLEELRYEMAELSLQTQELTKMKLEKELQKLKNGESLSASLSSESDTYSMNPDDVILDDIIVDESANESAGDGAGLIEEVGLAELGSGGGGESGFLEGVESVELSNDISVLFSAIEEYKELVALIQEFIEDKENPAEPEVIAKYIQGANTFYRKNLADEIIEYDTDENGKEVERVQYVLKDSVIQMFGDDTKGLEKLKKQINKMEKITEEYKEYLPQVENDASLLTMDEVTDAVPQDAAELDGQPYSADGQNDGRDETGGDPDNGTTIQPDNGNNSTPVQSDADSNDTENNPEKPGEPSETEPESETDDEFDMPPWFDFGWGDSFGDWWGDSDASPDSDHSGKYYVTVIDGTERIDLSYRPGDRVSGVEQLTAKSDETRAFDRWEVSPKTLAVTSNYNSETDTYYLEFTMPDENVTIEKVYTILPAAMKTYIDGFYSLAERAAELRDTDPYGYLSALETAIAYYQQWLAAVNPVVMQDEEEDPPYDSYELSENVKKYLESIGEEDQAEELTETYKAICMAYARTLLGQLLGLSIDTSGLEKVIYIYEMLGDSWREEIEKEWQNQTTDGSIPDYIAANKVIAMFQNFMGRRDSLSPDEQLLAVQEIMSAYQNLSDTQRAIVDRTPNFISVMQEYGTWGQEPETDFGYDDWGGGYSDWGEDYGEDRAELIKEKENEIKECELLIRECKLDLNEKERILEKKVVKSTLNGVVVCIGKTDGSSEHEYFAKVSGNSDLYAKGSMSELELEQINIGDRISGTNSETGQPFTAVITEISPYPEENHDSGYFWGGGSGNTNVSYYPFYALLDDMDGMSEGDAEIQLSGTSISQNDDDALYLENYLVRTDDSGKSYVYIASENGTLKKQYVTTGKTMYSYAIEIVSGVKMSDYIAFPYGKNVVEGAATRKVDSLDV